MNRLLLSVATACVSVSAIAGPVQKGLYEVQAGVNWDVAYDGNDKYVPVSAGLGYYVTDQIQVGALLSFTKKDEDSFWGVSDVWGLGAFCEYNFSGSDSILPYVGAAAHAYDGGGDVVWVGEAFGGMKYFFMPTVAVFGQINLSAASDEIYDFQRDWLVADKIDGKGENIGLGVSAGLRIVLW